MQATDRSSLLNEYVETDSELAFSGLFAQHVNLVYSVALRQVGDPHSAEEITQAVFIILAKKASQLRHSKALSSWLFQTTRLVANNFLREQARRHRRKQEAHMQSVLNESGEDLWPRIAPLLDDAVAALNENDRRAIVLRYYEGRRLSDVGAALGLNEDASKKRVGRALDKLRKYFAKRGVNSTTELIAGVILVNSVQAAPDVATTSALAALKGSSVAGTTLTLVKATLNVMTWLKLKLALGVTATMVLAGAVVTIALASGREVSNSPNPVSPDPPAVAAFKNYLSRPPCVARIEYTEVQSGQHWVAAVCKDDFYFYSPEMPGLMFGRSGNISWDFSGAGITRKTDTENKSKRTSLADSRRIVLNSMLTFAHQVIEPGSFKWTSDNTLTARPSRLFMIDVKMKYPEKYEGTIYVTNGHVHRMIIPQAGLYEYEYDPEANLPEGIPSKLTINTKIFTIQKFELKAEKEINPEIFKPEYHYSRLKREQDALNQIVIPGKK